MIRNMIGKWIQDKKNVTITCQFGSDRYAQVSGTITELSTTNDVIRLFCPVHHPNGTMIPLTSVHTIWASD